MTAKKTLGCLALAVAVPFLLVKPMLDTFIRQSIYPAPAIRVPSPPPAPFSEVVLPGSWTGSQSLELPEDDVIA